MKLECLTGSCEYPLFRLFHFNEADAAALLEIVRSLADGRLQRIALHELSWISAQGVCPLFFHVCSWDQGLVRRNSSIEFTCGLTKASWDNVAGLIEPFAEAETGFQWLVGSPETGGLVLSVNGSW